MSHSKTIEQACKQLAKSERGLTTMRELLDLFENSGWLSLDDANQEAVVLLLRSAWGPMPGTTREIMHEFWNAEGGAA